MEEWFPPSGAAYSRSVDAATMGDLRADAGTELRLGPLRAIFPLWIDDPVAGESRWNWRCLLGVDLAQPNR
jgi:hypothetical protein